MTTPSTPPPESMDVLESGAMSEFPLYALSEEHQAIREAVRAVADAKIAPFAAAVDEEARYPHEAAAALLASDFHAPHVPEQYGGVAMTTRACAQDDDRPAGAEAPTGRSIMRAGGESEVSRP